MGSAKGVRRRSRVWLICGSGNVPLSNYEVGFVKLKMRLGAIWNESGFRSWTCQTPLQSIGMWGFNLLWRIFGRN